MDLVPLGDRLIVEASEEEDVTASGIVLPDTAKEKPQRGSVLAVGPGPQCLGRTCISKQRRIHQFLPQQLDEEETVRHGDQRRDQNGDRQLDEYQLVQWVRPSQ